jgi:hypothetical protein
MLKSKTNFMTSVNIKYKFLAIFMVLAVLLTVIPFSNASAATKTKIIGGGSQYAIIAKQTTSSQPYLVIPVYASQAQHTKGYATTISVSSTKTNTCTASVSLTAGVDAVFAEFSTTMGVSSSVSYSTGSSVSYHIDANTASGKYRIEHVFPRYKVKQEKIRNDCSGTTVIWSRTITYAPRVNAAYRRLRHYA